METQNHGRPVWLTAAPAIFLLLWSAGFPVAKIGIGYADPLTLLALRYGAVVTVLLPFFLILRPPLPRRAADWGHLVVVGFLIQVVYFGLCYVAFELGISAGGLALIVALQPVLVALLAPSLVDESVGGWRWTGLALGLSGAALVIVSRSELGATSSIGIACAAGALFGMVAATLYEKRFGLTHHPVTANLIQYAVGLVAVLPAAMLFEPMRVDWTIEFAAALAYLVIGNSLIAITLLLAMIRVGEASRVSALFYLVPPCAAVIAWAMIGEAMPLLAWAGMALAALGVALAGRPPPRVRRV